MKFPEHIKNNPPTVILGQPGSGKTKELVSQVEKYRFRDGYHNPFDDFSFISYTRAGVLSGLERLGISRDEDVYQTCGTLHALCLRFGDLSDHQFIPDIGQFKDLENTPPISSEAAHTLNKYRGGGAWVPGDSASGGTIKAEYDNVCHRMSDKSNHSLYRSAIQEAKVADYTELMNLTLANGWKSGDYLHVKQVFIDEAQDLTPLMWEIVFRRFPPSANLCIAGDPRQRLYLHQGVDPNIFSALINLSLSHDRVIHQPVCHRLPKKIYAFASRVAEGFKDSGFWERAKIAPYAEKPGGYFGHIIDDYYLEAFFKRAGKIFDHITSNYASSETEERIPRLSDISLAYLVAVNKKSRPIFGLLADEGICPVVPGYDEPFRWLWSQHEVKNYLKGTLKSKTVDIINKYQNSGISGTYFVRFINKLKSSKDLDYALKRAYSYHCSVLVSTIHKVKGLEFPWVVVNWNRGYPGDNQGYLPTFYVGVTRASEGLVIHRDDFMRDPGIPLEGFIKPSIFGEEEKYQSEILSWFNSFSGALIRRAKKANQETN